MFAMRLHRLNFSAQSVALLIGAIILVIGSHIVLVNRAGIRSARGDSSSRLRARGDSGLAPFSSDENPEYRAQHASFSTKLDAWDAHVNMSTADAPALTLVPPSLESSAPKRTLVVYNYAHADWRLLNLEFFLRHGMVTHTSDGAEVDYTFVMNGYDSPLDIFSRFGMRHTFTYLEAGVDWESIQPVSLSEHERDNVMYVHVVIRENLGFDMCASKLVLEHGLAPRPGTYTHVVLMNGSVRGPFLPNYATFSWVDAFQQLLVDGVRLVGTTINCLNSRRSATAGFTSLHLQSMVLALDAAGVRAMKPMLKCYQEMTEAISHGEIGTTQSILAAGYGIAALQSSWNGFPVFSKDLTSLEVLRRCGAVSDSTGGDPSLPGAYMKGEPQPLEVIFIKTNRNLDASLLEHETQLRERFDVHFQRDSKD